MTVNDFHKDIVEGLPPKFVPVPFADVKLDTTQRDYLVKGVLASTGLAVIWGPPKCYKSFLAVDVAFHISIGREYRGHKVQQATVLYIALEGQRGFPARIEALRRHYGVTEAPFFLLPTALNLVQDAPQLINDITRALGENLPGAIFVDTLNRSLVGSESRDEDMGAYLAAAELIAQEYKCAVVIIHHCGIDATRPRGHTSLTGAVMSQIAVKRLDDHRALTTVECAKDFGEGAEIASVLEPIDLGTDPDGDPITSLIVLPTTLPQRAPKEAKLSKNQETMYAMLRDAGPAGLATEQWSAQGKAVGIGIKRPADLCDIRLALKNKKLVHEYTGRWNVSV
jgi:hypothetical protein